MCDEGTHSLEGINDNEHVALPNILVQLSHRMVDREDTSRVLLQVNPHDLELTREELRANIHDMSDDDFSVSI